MLDEKDIQKIIEATLRPEPQESVLPVEKPTDDGDDLNESYVAAPKTYKQVSELVSQRTKDNHTKLYEDDVTTLNRISSEIDSVNQAEAKDCHSEYRNLKLDECDAQNAVVLHELYFSNCFDPHSELFMDTKSYMRLQRDFGTFDEWQSDFLACAMANREGWAVCGYSTFLRRFVNTFFDGHSGNVMVGLIPVVVVDCFSHAYFRDYLGDRKSYVVAMMREFNWEIIESRFERLEKVHEAMK